MSVKVHAARPSRGIRARLSTGVAAERLVSTTSPLLLLLLWEGLGRAGVLDERFFPSPSAIASTALGSSARVSSWAMSGPASAGSSSVSSSARCRDWSSG